MAEPFTAEIRIFGFDFAPRGWAFCQGQLMPISQNTALYSIIGVMYGGDGRTTYGLPDLRGNAPMKSGDGPGLTPRREGDMGGEATVTLLQNQMPAHSHRLQTSADDADLQFPNQAVALAKSVNANLYNSSLTDGGNMDRNMIGLNGHGQSHNNLQPFLAINFCIALQGIFPG